MGLFRDGLESWAERLWYQERGLAFTAAVPVLGLGTFVTSVLSARRRAKQALASTGSIPVIAIGNLTVGGTGKTQVVLALAERALGSGRRVAVVSRGYGALERGPSVVPSHGAGDGDATTYGDEPALLARRLPGATIIVSRDRAAGVALAASRGCDLALLDDGLQQTRIAPARRVVVFGAESPVGNGALLPLGPLREPVGTLRDEDVIWLHGEGKGEVLPRVDVRSRTVPAKLDERLRGRPVFAFAGIARPERFFRTLSEAGASIVGTARFADHRRFSRRDLEGLNARAVALGAQVLVCTEKDEVRLPGAAGSLPIVALETRLEIEAGEGVLERLIEG